MIETQYNAKVRVLRSDNGGEYQSSDLQKYLEGHGIIHQTTCSNTPQQNGVAERKNRHLLEVVRASLIAAKNDILLGRSNHICRILDQSGIQTLDYDYHIYEDDESGKSELVNQEAGELDMSGQQFGSEDVFIEIPNQSSSAEGVLNLEPDPFMKRLPHRHNRAIPNSVQEALTDPRWKAAMNEEMKSLQKNETWELVECPLGKKPVGCRWIYTVKYKTDETFAPVAKINTVRVLLSLAANLDWPLQQFNVKNVFLHGELSEEVYTDLPPGCMVSEKQCQKETGMSGCQPVNTPIEEGLKLCVEPNQVSTDKGRYQRLVGRLMYLAHTNQILPMH
ncbi:Retrovirus-related Pol polyprotein from transposon TNT 1-94 [Vitis vinifera]|uniref:Retrovirus-related Pol polyprotein from transposon TNT 1-94 n=1 Tax=Vitis vinifera TaxID=29760 RepID=A0A438J5E5_VITVI|nr:Retrovirus-related Pol polyprotein from transposon TNT 1-94 [Vitis vinifera]